MDYEKLVDAALKAKERAYAPYSGFHVGAAVMTGSGRIFSGVNIENASFGATNCAERTAIFSAVSEGETDIKAVAITSDSAGHTFPCGICRQVIAEFADTDTELICANNKGEYRVYKLDELLPYAFKEFNNDRR